MLKKRIPWNKGMKGIYPYPSPMKGRKHKPDSLLKMSLALKGHASNSGSFKKGISGKNSVAWRGGIMQTYFKKQCNSCLKEFSVLKHKINAKYCSEKCYYVSLTGKPSKFRGKKRPELSGSKNPLWRGGVTKIQDTVRTCLEMSQWRKKIFVRDNYTCRLCGQWGGKLCVDHYPIQFAQVLKDNNITTLDQALQCPQLWDTNNGRTLCVPCHKKTETYLKKINKTPV